ncbi:MAG: PIN domain-containing protein [Acidobacteria bacterium]|nr:PIN domain-containing protein [Acidobacteriota bacterium]
MLLIDSSVWIELINGGIRGVGPEELIVAVTCPPVTQEVLQGLRQDRRSDEVRESFLAMKHLCDPVPLGLYLQAAEIYREGRRRGFTIRSAKDCLIAAIAIETQTAVWHRDRDFEIISRYTRLTAFQESPFRR